MKHRFRPYLSVSFPPGIMSAAMTSRKIVMATWMPWTVVFRSLLMSLIITFMFEPAKLQMNCASARGTSTRRSTFDGRPPTATGSAMAYPSRRGGPAQRLVEADRRIDERQVGERLREVADLLAGQGDLLGVQARVVAVGEHLLESGPRVVQPAGPGE